MTYKHYNLAIDEPLPFESGIQRALYLELCYRADNRGIVRIPQTQLATITLFSPRTVAYEFVRLQQLELLEKESFGHYKIIFDRPKSEENNQKLALRRWLVSQDTDALKTGHISVTEDRIKDQPRIFHEAITKGWLTIGGKQAYIAGKDQQGTLKTGYVIDFLLHL